MAGENRRDIVLTVEQQAAVEAGDGLVVVMSGAGTGKTTVLSHRVAHLVRSGIPGSAITAVTFTRDAAREIAERVRIAAGEPVRSGTMHALACRMLRDHWQAAGFTSSRFPVMTETETAPAFKEACDQVFAAVVPMDAPEQMVSDDLFAAADRPAPILMPRSFMDMLQVKSLKTAFRKRVRKKVTGWKENGLTPAAALARVEEIRRNGERLQHEEELGPSVYTLFQTALEARDTIEITDIIPRCNAMFAGCADIARAISAQVRHLLVDEYQDSNAVQTEFLRWLSHVHGNLTLVGDDDQSIYLFRGSIPDALRRADTHYPEAARSGVSRITLTVNRRNPDTVLRPANALVDHNPRHGPKRLASGRAGGLPDMLTLGTDDAEGKAVAKRIMALLRHGVPAREIAVLARGKRLLNAVAKELILTRTPHFMASGNAFLERAVVRDILAWMRVALLPGDDLSFQRAAVSPPRGLGEASIRAILAAGPHGSSVVDRLERCVAGRFQKLPGRSQAGTAAMLDILRQLTRQAAAGGSAGDLMQSVLETSGYLEWLESENQSGAREATSLLAVLHDVAAAVNLDEFADLILLADHDAQRPGMSRDGVHLGTIHSAKGREWDHVFIIALSQGLCPAAYSKDPMESVEAADDPWETEGGCIEEERRILHVAMSRARHGLVLTHAKNRCFGRETKTYRPSQFILEMDPHKILLAWRHEIASHGSSQLLTNDRYTGLLSRGRFFRTGLMGRRDGSMD